MHSRDVGIQRGSLSVKKRNGNFGQTTNQHLTLKRNEGTVKKNVKKGNVNPEIMVSFSKQNKKMDDEQLRLSVQILRVHTIQKQREAIYLWKINQQQLCDYFSKYSVFPYNHMTQEDLLDSQDLKLIKNEGKIYFGQINRKQRQGFGVNVTKDGKLYEGSFKDNDKEGLGIQVYPNGNLYMGEFHANKKHGIGKFYWFNLSTQQNQHVEYYDGDWWGGLPDGFGTHQKINGDIYVGTFKNGLKHGEGTQFFGNGDNYKGQYVNGLPQGYGEYVWIDYTSYKGDFKQGLRNGYGVWHAGKQKSQNYKGHYAMDKKAGYGVYEWENGWIYKGNFDKDLRNGFGQLYDGDQLIYRGFWQDGVKSQKQSQNNSNRNSSSLRKRKRIQHIDDSNNFYDLKEAQKQQIGRYQPIEIHERPSVAKRQNRSIDKQRNKRYQFGQFGQLQSIGDFVVSHRPQSYSGINRITNQRNRQKSKIGSQITRPFLNSKLYVPINKW